jgi:CHAT domain-containing protein
MFSRSLAFLFFVSLLLCLFAGNFLPLSSAPIPIETQVQTGVERYNSADYPGAIATWRNALQQYRKENDRTRAAIVAENLARAYQQTGQLTESLNYWREAIEDSHQDRNNRQVARLLTEQAANYSQLGQNRQAIARLCGADSADDCPPGTALALARQEKDHPTEIAALGTLGEAYRLRGEYDRSLAALEKALPSAPDIYRASLFNSLGNTYAAIARRESLVALSARQRGVEATARKFEGLSRENARKAADYFRSSVQEATEQGNHLGQTRASLNLVDLQLRFPDTGIESRETIERALRSLDSLAPSPEKVNTILTLALFPADSEAIAAPLVRCPARRYLDDGKAADLIDRAREIARKLDNPRSLSFALGASGHFHECRGNYGEALRFTGEALKITASTLENQDSAYLWQWQTGRILRAQGEIQRRQGNLTEADRLAKEELAAFGRAYALLEKIRNDLLLSERDVQFDFRDTIEPIYRQLARLKLENASQSDGEVRERELAGALETIDSLRLAELQNYFGNDCPGLLTRGKKRPIVPGTAVISSIILEDKTAVLLTLADGNTEIHWIDEERAIVEKEVRAFRESLIEARAEFGEYDTSIAKKLYEWFIAPFEAYLTANRINSLVFIQDGILRTIPMAALYDGREYLIQKYAVTTTPSLRTLADPKTDSRARSALLLGVTQASTIDEQSFSSLANVLPEIEEIQTLFPDHESLIDDRFDRQSLERQLNRSTYRIIHVATHARFGFVPEDTFLVAGDNSKLGIDRLEFALRSGGAGSVELLALTACQTAAGDERAALGLAGIAVQTGVKSALASLWSVPDGSTLDLVSEFYRQFIRSGASKAEALRAAQMKLIESRTREDINDEYGNPAYWSPFILIGDPS